MSLIVTDPKSNPDKSNPLGPERSVPVKGGNPDAAAPARPNSKITPMETLAPVRTGQLSLLDAEIEALRRTPSPTQCRSRTA